MAVSIPESHRALFEKRCFAHLATLMPDGQPQTTPVWCALEGRHVVINTARGRQKEKNIARDPRVALSITDPDDPYRYLEVRGRVVDVTEDSADEHIDRLAHRYLGSDYPGDPEKENRVIVRIEPEHVTFR